MITAGLPEGKTGPDAPIDPHRQLFAASWLAGIGFTISLFIANDVFVDPLLTTTAKLGILVASVIAGTVGFLLLRATTISHYDESSRIEGTSRVKCGQFKVDRYGPHLRQQTHV